MHLYASFSLHNNYSHLKKFMTSLSCYLNLRPKCTVTRGLIESRQFEYQTSTLENKMVSICLVFKWSGYPIFKWHSKRTIWHPTSFRYSDPHCLDKSGIQIPTVYSQISIFYVKFVHAIFYSRSLHGLQLNGGRRPTNAHSS